MTDLTDEQRFREGSRLRELGDRGLFWELDSRVKPARATAETPSGQAFQKIVVRHDNPYTAALRLVDAVVAADMRAVKRVRPEPPVAAPRIAQLSLTGEMP